MKQIKLGDYIDILTDYHSGGSYKTLKEKTKILYEPNYAVMIRTLNFENDDFTNDLIYCDKSSYDFLAYSHVHENDILMNKIANPGSVYIMPKVEYKTTCGMNLFLIRLKNISQRYMYYVMKYNESYIKSQTHGTTTKTITKDEVRDLVFYIHETREEQNRVEQLLSTIDSKISNNKKIINALNNITKLIYDYWFVQFDFPDENGKPYKSSGGKMVWNEELKREIPDGWEVKHIDDLISQLSGFPFSSNDYVNSGNYKLYTIKNVQDGFIDDKVDNTIDSIPHNMDKGCILSVGDMIMSLTGNVGRVGIVYEKNALLNQRVLKLIPKVSSKMFIYQFIRSDEIQYRISQIAVGTSQKNLSPIELGSLLVIKPNEKIIDKYKNACEKMYERITGFMQENQELASLRDLLLPMLMNGQVKIKEH